MTIRGWEQRYAKILKKFGYSRRRDEEAARLLDSTIRGNAGPEQLRAIIAKKPVFVVGAGSSIPEALPVLKKFKKTPIIAADSAVRLLVENDILPDIVVTDLDGDRESLLRASQSSIMVVHAHGDNMGKIPMAECFSMCVGTTQSKPSGRISNFGGFTDGDRAVFLASHFGAKRIVMLGMDFGQKIGRHSDTKRTERPIKLRKLTEARGLLEWLATKNPRMYSTSPIRGVRKITLEDIGDIVIT